MLLKTYPFTIRQGQQLVVVHHRVHVFNPQGIDVAIKHDVLSFVLLCGFIDVTEDTGKKTVCPVSGYWIQRAVQFNNGTCFSVECVQLRGNSETICKRKD